MPDTHPSSQWTTYRRAGGRHEPHDPNAFRRLMHNDDFPRASRYDPTWVTLNLMGPNSLWLAEGLTQTLPLEPGMRILDLGCGTAITSIFLAREFGAVVWAADLWIDPTDNAARIAEADVADRVFPLEVEAHRLPFARVFFDGIVSIDAYHYFGTDIRYLSYLVQFVRPGGFVAIVVPGNAADPDERAEGPDPELFELFGADWFTFRSADWWRRHWSRTKGVVVERAEMVPDGWATWHRHAEADAAWSGVPVAEQPDGPLLLSRDGATLGFVRAVARRVEATAHVFGPGRYRTRLA